MIENIKRVSVGIPGFDSLIEGGFKKDSINLVAGSAGSGKTIFAMHFLVDGLEKNEACLYITFEGKKKKIYEDMSEFGWDLEKYEKKEKFVFMEYTPEQVKKVLVEGGGTIEAIIEQHKIKRLVIDSITSFALLYQDELTKKESALALFELINNWNCTALLTSQATYSDRGEISAALDFEVDGIIYLYHIKKGGLRKRGIEIIKMRGTKIPEKTFSLDITSKGIRINTKEVVAI